MATTQTEKPPRSSVALPESVWRRVRVLAAQTDRTMNDVIETAVMAYLKENKA